MTKYLIQGTYTADGAKGLLAGGGSTRRQIVGDLVAQLGGSMEAFYFAFGESDIFAIVDVPDAATMTAIALTVGGSGAVAIETTVLITPEEVDAASGIAVNYTPPGG